VAAEKSYSVFMDWLGFGGSGRRWGDGRMMVGFVELAQWRTSSKNERYNEQYEENHEEHVGNPGGGAGNAAEAQGRGNEGDDEEGEGVAEHDVLSVG
jgi:hypothetical protein